jgi:hypothetical protein
MGLQAALQAMVPMPREEATSAIDILTGGPAPNRGVLLTGSAGMGKSEVLRQIVTGLRERGIPVLAFRLDRLDPVSLGGAIGTQLGLPGSPVGVLAAVAQGRDCVLVIDQLDAVSRASGRHPQFFDSVDALLSAKTAESKTGSRRDM